jgi:hypothetical protein
VVHLENIYAEVYIYICVCVVVNMLSLRDYYSFFFTYVYFRCVEIQRFVIINQPKKSCVL